MTIVDGAPQIETQGAFMAAAAASALLLAILRDRREPRTLLFGSLILAFALWAVARGAADLGARWANTLELAGLTLIGVLGPIVAAGFAGQHAQLRRYAPALGVGPLLLGVWLTGGAPGPKLLWGLSVGWTLACLSAGALLLMRPGLERVESDSPDATRLRYVAIAQLGVVFAAGADLLAWQLGGPRIASLLAALLYLYAGYLYLLGVRVADLRQLIGSSIALSLLALLVAGIYGAIWIWVGARLDLFVLNAFVVSFVLFLGMDPIRVRAERWILQRFVAERLELERTFQPLIERLATVFTLDELLHDVLEAVEASDRLSAAAIFLRDDPQVGFQQVGSIGLAPARRVNLIRAPAWVATLEAGDVLLREELQQQLDQARDDDQRARNQALLETMDALDAQLVLPLRSDQLLLGFFALRDERDREPFSAGDMRFLRSTAEQIAIAIGNTKTFERVRIRDRYASLGEMAAGLAHEIRNPLAAIRAAASVLEDPGTESTSELHAVISDEIERLDRVVGTFLDYARPSVQREPIRDLGQFVRGCVESVARNYRTEHGSEQVAVRVHIEDDLPPITANSDHLERVIENVVENSFQALDGSGSLEVSVTRSAGEEKNAYVEICITDTGPGMDEQTIERAFIPFFTTRTTGTGLGLALSERLVRAQGGTIHLTSREGVGTTMYIRLPVDGVLPDGEEVMA